MKVFKLRFPIGSKILLGFIPLLGLIFSISTITLVRLDRVNRINQEIVSVDMAAETTAGNMEEILLAQESYGRRYLILMSDEMLSLFEGRNDEFTNEYAAAKTLRKSYPEFDSVINSHTAYRNRFREAFTRLDSIDTLPSATDAQLRKLFDRQVKSLRSISRTAKTMQNEKMNAISGIGKETYRRVAILTIVGIVLIVLITALISGTIIRSVGILKAAANMVSLGTFIHLPKVTTRDELGDLSAAFNEMADRLIKLEEASKDASPLTRLPGGVAIENTVKLRIERNEPFAFCMMDLDNFKPFNDRYGYGRGNSVIKMTAEIIQTVARGEGDGTEFVGHIGGDDFALVTKPELFEMQCRMIIDAFDKQIIDHYDEEDREKRCILSVSRQGEHLSFPIMTISIAAVNSLKSTVHNYIEVGEILAELKKYAKQFSTSNLVIDRRGGKKKKGKPSRKEADVAS
ncbi:MAG: diguanylate cyclase [Chitinispirillaceae bacterium]|nr:diguanylate cyclase [Chitinispirillaceae bacterium]